MVGIWAFCKVYLRGEFLVISLFRGELFMVGLVLRISFWRLKVCGVGVGIADREVFKLLGVNLVR